MATYSEMRALERRSISQSILKDLLPLDPKATFEELVLISKKFPGKQVGRDKLDKAIKSHPSFKKVVANLNTGESGRNYKFLQSPEITIGSVNKVYQSVKERDVAATKILEPILQRTGNDPVKLIEEYNKTNKKLIKGPLADKIRSLPEYKEFLNADKSGFSKAAGSKIKAPDIAREMLRFITFNKFTRTLPEGSKYSDFTPLEKILKSIGKENIPTPKRNTGVDGTRYKFFDYKQLEKMLGSSIVSPDGREFFKNPTDSQISKLRRFFKDGAYLFGENTEDVVKAIHKSDKLQNLLKAKDFPDLQTFKPELEKVLGKEITSAQVSHGTRVYSDWTKGSMYKNMGLDFKPSPAETRLGNKIYSQLLGFKRNNPWSKGEYEHAMREIKANMPKEAGSLRSFKSYMSRYLPKGFLEQKNLNVNEVFSVTQTSRNKAYPYSYFVDVIDADINQKNLANLQGRLSTAVRETRNQISKLRAGDNSVSYKDLEKTISNFQKERKTFGDTIKRNFPGKNFNLPDIVLGSEKEILSNDFDIADKIYSSKNLQKWKDQGIDIAKHAKTEGYAMTGADKKTTFLFRDLVNTSKDLFKKASAPEQYEIAFKLGCVGGNADGGRIGFALGTGTVTCVNKKLADETHLPKLTALDDSSPLLGKMKNAASTFFNVAKKDFNLMGKYGKFGAVAGLGAAAAGVKEFFSDDPSTYLSNENQQKNMLIDMVTEPIAEPTEKPAILEAQMPVLGAALVAGTIPGAKDTYLDAITGRGPKGPAGSGLPANIVNKPVGKFRATLGINKGVLGKGLAALGTPAGMLATEPFFIGNQIAEGDSVGEIATNPMNYLGAAFASPLTKMATKNVSPTMANIMRLGLSPARLFVLSKMGQAGLLISGGIAGYNLFKDYRNKEGFFEKDNVGPVNFGKSTQGIGGINFD